MTITEFFDPENLEHLKAYMHLCENGAWPKGFIPDELEFSPAWQSLLAFKMARKWLELKLRDVR